MELSSSVVWAGYSPRKAVISPIAWLLAWRRVSLRLPIVRLCSCCFGVALGAVQVLQTAVVAAGRGQEPAQGTLALRHGVEVALRQQVRGLLQQCGGALGVVAQCAQFFLAQAEGLLALLDVVLGLLELRGERVQACLGLQCAFLPLELFDVGDGGWPVEFRVGGDAGQEGEGAVGSGAGLLPLLEFAGGGGEGGALAGEVGGVGEEGVELGLRRSSPAPSCAGRRCGGCHSSRGGLRRP
ncbi:hypothetical protein [Streptomyces sp. Mo3]|uniref:hypothetical protein n=1 Tax=Streptomyces sp. Mo3 TaxID=3161190 RepID=UPI0039EE364A